MAAKVQDRFLIVSSSGWSDTLDKRAASDICWKTVL